MNLKMDIHNRFDVEVIDTRTGKIRQKAQAQNVICTKFWERSGNQNTWSVGWIVFGSGSGTPDESDTTLFDYLGGVNGTNNVQRTWDNDNKVLSYVARGQLSESQYVGDTLTEVGIGYYGTSGPIVTHAMLQDMNGNPISIEKTDTDIINIYATVFCHWDDNKINVKGNNGLYNFLFGSYWGASLEIGTMSVVESPFMSSLATVGYGRTWDSENRILRFNGSRLTVADANTHGIRLIRMARDYGIDFIFDTEDFYAGDTIANEAIGTGDGTTKRFYTKFNYPENAQIFVNGVQLVSGYTVRRISRENRVWVNTWVMNPHSTASNNGFIMQVPSMGSKMGVNPWAYDAQGYPKFVVLADGIFFNANHEVGFEYADLRSSTDRDGVKKKPKLYGSNDLSSWTFIAENTQDADPNEYISSVVQLNSTQAHYKYYKLEGAFLSGNVTGTAWDRKCRLGINTDEDFCQIIFDTAPAVGDVITANYHTPCIAKDTDHVLDISMGVQIGPYSL